jgi:hypothetical protein
MTSHHRKYDRLTGLLLTAAAQAKLQRDYARDYYHTAQTYTPVERKDGHIKSWRGGPKATKQRYMLAPVARDSARRSTKKYRKTPKGKAMLRRMRMSDKGRAQGRCKYRRQHPIDMGSSGNSTGWFFWGLDRTAMNLRSNPRTAETLERDQIRRRDWMRENRRRIRQASPAWRDRKAIATVYAEKDLMTWATGVEHHVDHMHPINHEFVCGLHVHQNLQVLVGRDNIQKSNKMIMWWQ